MAKDSSEEGGSAADPAVCFTLQFTPDLTLGLRRKKEESNNM